MLSLVIQHQPDRTLPHLGRKLVRCLACHGSTFSRVGASDKPGAVHADYLDSLTAPLNEPLLRELMLFTNDLDATRGQDFRRTHAEFVRLAAEDGFEWTGEIRFAEGDTRQRPAKDRDYAWI